MGRGGDGGGQRDVVKATPPTLKLESFATIMKGF